MICKKRKILIVSGTFFPQKSPRSHRTTELSLELARLGHDVNVYIPFCDYDYSEFERINSIKVNKLERDFLPKIPYINLFLISYICRLLSRGLNLLFEYPDIQLLFLVKQKLKYLSGFDTMISIAVPYPIHWGCAFSIKKNKQLTKIWIADCGDPYMFDKTDTFRKLFYFKYLEKYFCRKADYISVPFEDMRRDFYPEFYDKTVVIPQGFNLDFLKNLPLYKKNDVPTFAFSGFTVPEVRDPKQLIDYLGSIDTPFKFIVYTKQKNEYLNSKLYSQGKIELREYVDRVKLIYELSKCDFLINLDAFYEKGDRIIAMPSKLIDYASARRPILNIVSGHLNIPDLNNFLIGNYANARVVDIDHYDIKLVASQFLMLDKIHGN